MYYDIALVPGLLGFGILLYGVPTAARARASRAWPEAQGRITSVNVAKIWVGRGSIYYPDIRYEFAVGDSRFEGSRIGFASTLPRSSHGATVYALQHSYPRGKSVMVSYNPGDPNESVLETGIRAGLRTLLGAGALLLVVAIAVVVARRFLDAAGT